MRDDRFNHNVDRKVETKAAPLRRVEVITGVERRRDWPDEKKLAIVAESCQDGVVISDVARRHGLRPQQLFAWRSEFRKREAAGRLFGGMSGGTQGGTQAFAPVMIANERPAVAAAETPAMAAYPLPAEPASPKQALPLRRLETGFAKTGGVAPVEIVLGCATVRLHGCVDTKTLAAVLGAVKAIA